MKAPKDLSKRITAKYGKIIDLKENPGVLQDIFEEVAAMIQTGGPGHRKTTESPPFNVSWMDSWVAHWAINETILTTEAKEEEFPSVLRDLVDLKFNERMGELRRFIREYPRFMDEPPDGGPPEPGAPPGGPAAFEAPDAGPPEPGTPPAGPSVFEPPDAGPPEPGVPPTGPEAGFMSENPWILYWFVSIKAPLILEMIDAHLTRRMSDLRGSSAAT